MLRNAVKSSLSSRAEALFEATRVFRSLITQGYLGRCLSERHGLLGTDT
jgi:hypothetical protein